MFERVPKSYPADIRPLTSLRFVAALVIVAYHITLVLPYGADAWSGLLAKGYLGVDFFFILSGFILAHVYLDTAQDRTLKPVAFYGRRLARVYPVHLLTLGLALLPYAIGILGGVPEIIPDYMRPGYIVSHFFMVHAWGLSDRYILNALSWSISAEWFAYLLFPFLAVAMARVRPVPMLVLAAGFFWGLYAYIAVLPAGAGLFDSGRALTVRTFDFGIIRILPEFVMGMALYRAGRVWALRGPAHVWLAGWSVLLAGLVHFNAPDYMVVPMFAGVIYLAAETARQGHTGILDRPWMVLMGEASYSLYMIHYLWFQLVFAVVLQVVPGPEPVWVQGLCMAGLLPVILWSSLVCYRRVEQPWRHRLWTIYARIFRCT